MAAILDLGLKVVLYNKTDIRNEFLILKLVKIHKLHIDLLQIVFELNFHIAREGIPLKGLGKPP